MKYQSTLYFTLSLINIAIANNFDNSLVKPLINAPTSTSNPPFVVVHTQTVTDEVEDCKCDETISAPETTSAPEPTISHAPTFITQTPITTKIISVADICHVCKTIEVIHKQELIETIVYSCPTSQVAPPLSYPTQSSLDEPNPITTEPPLTSFVSPVAMSDLTNLCSTSTASIDLTPSSCSTSNSIDTIFTFTGYFNTSTQSHLTESTTPPVTTSIVTSSPIKSSGPVDTINPSYSARFFPATANGYNGNLFIPIATDAPIVPQGEISFNPVNVEAVIPRETNKFYTNFFAGDQSNNIWTYPYGLSFDDSEFHGLGIQHTDPDARVFVSDNTNNPQYARYYFNPVLTEEIVLSAVEFENDLSMKITEMGPMSATAVLTGTFASKLRRRFSTPLLTVPMVQGMGFVTGIYHGGATPVISSKVGISMVSKAVTDTYVQLTVTLNGGTIYYIYITGISQSDAAGITFNTDSNGRLISNKSIDGAVFQVSVKPSNADPTAYLTQAAGCYPTSATLFATTSEGVTANYGWTYTTEGRFSGCVPLIYLLPHHFNSISDETASQATNLILSSTTKGRMVGFLTNTVSLDENLQFDLQFLPTGFTYSPDEMEQIVNAVNTEIQADIKSIVTSYNSIYYSGKSLDKYAYLLLVVNDVLQNEPLAQTLLTVLKETIQIFINNDQTNYPLMYDTKMGGITSTASETGNAANDFGAAWYNDHHFHYGYFIHAAAVIAKVDQQFGGSWANDIASDWINGLIRDVSNPSSEDTYFPVFRMFDWFHGHSWASGLFASADGQNEESSSEDYNYAYGIKLWGKITDNKPLESMGDLMLQVMKHSMNNYFLFSDGNNVEPANFVGNKVDGIMFDNKMDYSTYFGTAEAHPEYVHGIHMLPITPASAIIRGQTFVSQEWNEQVATFIDNVTDGWLGVLRMNQALFDASSSYNFFSDSRFLYANLDNGQSRSWALAYAAGVANKGGNI